MKKIALLVTERNDSYYGHIEAYVVNIDDGKVRNINTSVWDEKPNAYYHDMYVTCQMSANHEGSYAWTVEYKEPLSIDMEKASRMYKTLKSINTKIGKTADQIGHPDSFGSFCAYVANAVGAKSILVYKENGRRSSYDDCDFSFHTIPYGKTVIDEMVKKIQADLTPDAIHVAA